jgi:uncharacterized protein YxeA
MKKLIRTILILVVAAIALVWLKPSDDNFEQWVHKRYKTKRQNANGENLVEKLADKGVNALTEVQVLATYKYSNHYLFATAKAYANGEEKKYLGIAGTWLPLPSL